MKSIACVIYVWHAVRTFKVVRTYYSNCTVDYFCILSNVNYVQQNVDSFFEYMYIVDQSTQGILTTSYLMTYTEYVGVFIM